jgi:hypothetical protein
METRVNPAPEKIPEHVEKFTHSITILVLAPFSSDTSSGT